VEGFQIGSTYGFECEFQIIEELYFIFVFQNNTPDIKHYVGEDHSNSISTIS
jgi:hypothetical protein